MTSPWNQIRHTTQNSGGQQQDRTPRVHSMPDTQWEALASVEAPRVPWDVFLQHFDWKQSQHVGVIGPNGQGKTTLMLAIMPLRKYVAFFATKPRDATLEKLTIQGFVKYEEWPNHESANKTPKRLIWPDAREIDSEENQRKVFDHAFSSIFREGGWCLVIDEGWYHSEVLKLKQRMRAMWTQARSLGISFVVGTQRPAWVPVEMYDESTHLFIFRLNERAAVQRVSDLGAANVELARYLIRRLETHQCLYINTRTGKMMRTHAPRW
jgi:hypothetical protein